MTRGTVKEKSEVKSHRAVVPLKSVFYIQTITSSPVKHFGESSGCMYSTICTYTQERKGNEGSAASENIVEIYVRALKTMKYRPSSSIDWGLKLLTTR